MVKRIGFLVNPIAGMGGAVGLKGTDGERTLRRAKQLGAKPIASRLAKLALENLRSYKIKFFTCSVPMGEYELSSQGLEYKILYKPSKKTTAKDTKEASRRFLGAKIDLLLFCGGDGTARDIYSVVGKKVPILGIPAGVKMHSSVFGVSAGATRKVVVDFLRGSEVTDGEIMDTDEEKYRRGELDVKLYGYACIPASSTLVQRSKSVVRTMPDALAKKDIARWIVEQMEDEFFYILGPGTTVKAIARSLGVDYTLLGVDVLKGKKLIKKDANEQDLLKLLESEQAKIIISPIGAQGFVLGRGNQQISSGVIEKVGPERILIISTPAKLAKTSTLFVDTGDEKLNARLRGHRRIITGYHEMKVRRVK